jgi:hypothetical protein
VVKFCYWEDIYKPSELEYFKNKIENHYNKICSSGGDIIDWDCRTLDITNYAIGDKTKTFLENNLSIKLNIVQIQCQVWPVGTESTLHRHCDDVTKVRLNTDYNSMLYLNDNFEGGEFYTNDIIYKPRKNTLTFFDGANDWHGIKPVRKNNRYTIIFWWKSN